MTLRLFDTASNRPAPLRTVEPGVVRFYSCGPTVYANPHIGNFRTFLLTDLLRRHLETSGLRVRLVMNVTDVEDKIIAGAHARGVPIGEFTAPHEANFFEDLARLRVRPAAENPHATGYVPGMIEMTAKLIERGHAYVADDGVYYRISSFPPYGSLAHLDRAGLRAGARIASDEYDKESASDFALWKLAERRDEEVGAAWDSPWGRGRPGWHIECSVMSTQILGETLDLHAGGVDLKFPHHENEIAQSEGATGRPFCRHWAHGEFVIAASGDKMAKSLGNVTDLRAFFDRGYEPAAVRLFLLASAHYRSKLRLTDQGLHDAAENVRRLREVARRLHAWSPPGTDDARLFELVRGARRRYREALDDDLNLARGLGHLMDLVREANTALDAGALGHAGRDEIVAGLAEADQLLDVLAAEPERLDQEVERAIAEREDARRRRDFGVADRIREELRARGILLEDTSTGVRWRRVV
ncbi:MAG: cysteine--tRNA ligase [Candidatus Dormibacteraceae bacterium]